MRTVSLFSSNSRQESHYFPKCWTIPLNYDEKCSGTFTNAICLIKLPLTVHLFHTGDARNTQVYWTHIEPAFISFIWESWSGYHCQQRLQSAVQNNTELHYMITHKLSSPCHLCFFLFLSLPLLRESVRWLLNVNMFKSIPIPHTCSKGPLCQTCAHHFTTKAAGWQRCM